MASLPQQHHRSRRNEVGVSIETAEECVAQLEALRQPAINSGRSQFKCESIHVDIDVITCVERSIVLLNE